MAGTVGKAVRKQQPQAARGAQQCTATVAVVRVSWEDGCGEEVAVDIGQRVALVPDNAAGEVAAA